MRLGTYDIHPGIAVTIAMLAIALVCFAGLWLKNSKTSTALNSFAQTEAWTRIGPAPDALIDALSRLHVSYKWNASTVMSVNGLSDTIYLFHFE